MQVQFLCRTNKMIYLDKHVEHMQMLKITYCLLYIQDLEGRRDQLKDPWKIYWGL